MSGGPSKPKSAGVRLIQIAVLVSLFAMLFAATRLIPETHGHVSAIAGLGFLLLAGTLTSELLEILKLPHLTGYLFAGVIAGPHVLNLVDHHAVDDLSQINALALALIAFAGGAELEIETIRANFKSLSWAMFFQCIGGTILVAAVFVAARPLITFVQSMSWSGVIGVAIMWGALAVSRSPSALLGILSQTKAKGPVATFSLAFVMSSDVVVLVMLALILTLIKPLIDPSATIAAHTLEELWNEILGSIAIGTTLGLILTAYLRLIGRELVMVLVLLGFGFTAVLKYLHFDPLLTFLTAGFVVRNLSNQGPALLHAIERTSGVVYVVFFALAGAHLDIPLLKKLWPAAVVLAVSRAVFTWGLARVASALANDSPEVRNWGWSSLVSQAGLTLGMSVVIAKQFPSFGDSFRSLVIAVVAMNEVVGPILFKYALDKNGESRKEEPTRQSLVSLVNAEERVSVHSPSHHG